MHCYHIPLRVCRNISSVFMSLSLWAADHNWSFSPSWNTSFHRIADLPTFIQTSPTVRVICVGEPRPHFPDFSLYSSWAVSFGLLRYFLHGDEDQIHTFSSSLCPGLQKHLSICLFNISTQMVSGVRPPKLVFQFPPVRSCYLTISVRWKW